MYLSIDTVAGSYLEEADDIVYADGGWAQLVKSGKLVAAYSQFPAIRIRVLTTSEWERYNSDVEPEAEESEEEDTAYADHLRQHVMGIGQPPIGGRL